MLLTAALNISGLCEYIYDTTTSTSNKRSHFVCVHIYTRHMHLTNHAPFPPSGPHFLVPLERLFTFPARLFPRLQTLSPDAFAFAFMRGD